MKSSASTAVTEGAASPTRLPAWSALASCADRIGNSRIDALHAADPRRFNRCALTHDGILADFSKQLIDDETRESLLRLATEAGLASAISALFSGEHLNFTEDRAALHMALRGGCDIPAEDTPLLQETGLRLRSFAQALREGTIRGAHGEVIRRVINLGIGGSDLGPRMAREALGLAESASAVDVRFVANIDPRELDEALADADPRTTLFVISSKSFSTLETLANARAAREWLCAGLGAETATGAHFAAVSNEPEQAMEFGIGAERVFAVPAWIGGRFSVWSAVGLPLMVAIGVEAFDALLAGARSIDLHFRDSPFAHNIPTMMALAGIWNGNFLGIESLAVLPYAHGLRSFPAWLQQLDMESNGKRCLRDGTTSTIHTAPIVWGASGTVGQHAFHQLLYQGTRRVAADFIVAAGPGDARSRALRENALAQSEALMSGRDINASLQQLRSSGLDAEAAGRLAPHLVCPGNLPSTTLLLPALTPYTLGQLMALYEHKVFVQGWIWGINSFDQYGVELGKNMARSIAGSDGPAVHAATAGLLSAIAAMSERS